MKQFATLAVMSELSFKSPSDLALTDMLRRLLANRSMIPPSLVTVNSPNGETVLRDFFSVFPVDHLVFDKALPLLESQYVQHALPHHSEDYEATSSLLAENNINMAAYGGVEQVVEALQAQEWRDRLSITLANWQSGRLGGETLDSLADVQTCADLHEAPGCARICRK